MDRGMAPGTTYCARCRARERVETFLAAWDTLDTRIFAGQYPLHREDLRKVLAPTTKGSDHA